MNKSKKIWEHQWTSIIRTWSTNLGYSWITSHVCFPVKWRHTFATVAGATIARSSPEGEGPPWKWTEFLLRFIVTPCDLQQKQKGFNFPPFLQFCDCIFLYVLSFWVVVALQTHPVTRSTCSNATFTWSQVEIEVEVEESNNGSGLQHNLRNFLIWICLKIGYPTSHWYIYSIPLVHHYS